MSYPARDPRRQMTLDSPATDAAEHLDLWADYRPTAAAWDEVLASSGSLRPHWRQLAQALGDLAPTELADRSQETLRLLRENGVTYNVYDVPGGMQRTWALDPIPLVISSREWSRIEAGLVQRAELLNAVLADLYGPRTLVRQGVLPAELVHAHPGFLYPCHGVQPPQGRHLPLYAADLARGPGGDMLVLADRTQAPSGAGYALENRMIMARVWPQVLRDSHATRLNSFFRALRTTLNSLAPQHHDNPRVVVLTPGQGNETYFEHAFLAHQLGYSLVQGNDLTVRDGQLWLKTLAGLQGVDVVLRRVDDSFCDPLELNRDSLLGVAGLLQTVRTQQVAIANPLGSGALENAALMGYLPQICRKLLNQDLLLPQVQSWWCGAAKERQYVLANLERLIVKTIVPHRSNALIYGGQLTTAERYVLADRIRARPSWYVGQEPVSLSTAPVLVDGRPEPRSLVLRSFLVAWDGGYEVMPGGLTRVAPSLDTSIVSNQRGGISKDTWIVSAEPEQQASVRFPSGQPLHLSRGGAEVPSRVADNLFWLGRYAERTKSAARLLREVLLRRLDPESESNDDCLPALLAAVTRQTGVYPGFVGEGAAERRAAPDEELLSIILDGSRLGSLRFNINALEQAGHGVRDLLSDDTWRVIHRLGQRLSVSHDMSHALEDLEQVILLLAAFSGLTIESLGRGQGFHFVDIGRRLERGLATVGLLRSTFVQADDSSAALWEAVLAVTDSLSSYRRRYRFQVQAGAVLDLLLHDEGNPRSVGYQLLRIQKQLADLPRKVAAGRLSTEERLVMEARSTLRLADVESISQLIDEGRTAEALDPLLSRLNFLLPLLSEAISSSYFSHTDMPQQLVGG